MKRKILWLVILALLIGAGFGLHYYRDTYLYTEHGILRQDAVRLDLRGVDHVDLEHISALTKLKWLDLRDTGLSVAEYEKLKAALPSCQILWQVPIQGAYLELDTTSLEIVSLTSQEVDSLKYLSALERIAAENCSDLDLVMALKAAYPQVQVDYLVPIGGKTISGDVQSLSGCNATVPELMEKLRYLPKLEELSLAVAEPDNEEVYSLIQAYPNVKVRWNVALCGRRFSSTIREMNLSGTQVASTEEVEAALKYFPNLERVIMCDCGIPSEEMDAMWKRNPEVRFVWTVSIAGKPVRTDVTTFMPYQYGIVALRNQDAQEMKHLVDVVCMDLGHMGIKDLSFLWTMPDLEYLIIADCGITDITPVKALTKLKYLEAFQNNIRDISALASCVSLRDLNLCYNAVRDFSPLYGLEKIEHLWIASNYVTNDTMYTLNDTFPVATIMYRTFSSTGNGWRKIPGYYEQRDLLGMWYMTY